MTRRKENLMTVSCNRLLVAGATAALVASIQPAAATTSDLGVVPVPIATPGGNPGPFEFWLDAEVEPGVSVLEACGVDPTAILADAIRVTNPKNSSTSIFFSEELGISLQLTSDDGFVTLDWLEDPLNELDPRPQQLGFILCLGVVGGPQVGTNLYLYQGLDATLDGNLSTPVFGETVNKVYAAWEEGACLEPEEEVQASCDALFGDLPAEERANKALQVHDVVAEEREFSICSCGAPVETCVKGEPGCTFAPGQARRFGGQSEITTGTGTCTTYDLGNGKLTQIGDTC